VRIDFYLCLLLKGLRSYCMIEATKNKAIEG
jgi:hypothetical protein